jgi:hypothetical protein
MFPLFHLSQSYYGLYFVAESLNLEINAHLTSPQVAIGFAIS